MRRTVKVALRAALREMASQGVWLCSTKALARLAGVDAGSLRVVVARDEELQGMRVGKSHFLNPFAQKPMQALAQLAPVFRKHSHYYLSLESVLHEHDWISQIPNRLTFVTNGSSAVYETPLGVLEFNRVSTKKFEESRMSETVFDAHRLIFVASPELALRDLKAIGRSVDLVREPGMDGSDLEVQR